MDNEGVRKMSYDPIGMEWKCPMCGKKNFAVLQTNTLCHGLSVSCRGCPLPREGEQVAVTDPIVVPFKKLTSH